jgi:hypothetical protein
MMGMDGRILHRSDDDGDAFLKMDRRPFGQAPDHRRSLSLKLF